jgi:hypothetical protein
VVELGDTFLKEETNTFLSGECDACWRYIKALRWRRVRFGGGGKSVSVEPMGVLGPT